MTWKYPLGGATGPAGPTGATGAAGVGQPFTFGVSGTLTVTSYTARLYAPQSCTVQSIRASVGTAPTGTAVIVDVQKNGTSMFTGVTGNRPTIAVSTNTATAGARAAGADLITAGDYFTVSVTQIGSGTAGADATVEIAVA